MKLKFILFIILTSLSIEVKAQDPIFTQYFFVPETLNPAFTGTLNTWYTGIIHRVQWPDGDKKITTDYGFVNGSLDTDGKMAVGLTFLNNHEVFTDYNLFQINGAFAYNININSDWKLRLGIEAGYANKNYNFSNILLADQITKTTGSITDVSGDPSLAGYKESFGYFDISSGLLLYDDNFWFGVALKHLSTPNIAFTDVADVPLSMFLSVQGGYSFDIGSFDFIFRDDLNLLVTANYMRQSQYNRLDFGGAFEFDKFTLGTTISLNPEGKSDESQILTSINPFASIQIQRFVLGYSYDINTSAFGNNKGIHELSLTFQIGRECSTCNNYLVNKPWGRNY